VNRGLGVLLLFGSECYKACPGLDRHSIRFERAVSCDHPLYDLVFCAHTSRMGLEVPLAPVNVLLSELILDTPSAPESLVDTFGSHPLATRHVSNENRRDHCQRVHFLVFPLTI
jgi:hypothetical protein